MIKCRMRGENKLIFLTYTVDTEINDKAWDIWIGPFGVHIYWPDLHKSRPDYYEDWNTPKDIEWRLDDGAR